MIITIPKNKKIIPKALIQMLINSAEAIKANHAPREMVRIRQTKSRRNKAANRKRSSFLKLKRAKKQDKVKGMAVAK